MLNLSSTVTLKICKEEKTLGFSHRKTIVSNMCERLERASQDLRIRNCLLNFLESNSR